ncbi:MAG: hypothetical protein NUW37_17265 [Planctomycetes bacterium]|nr:hypothetical protein [Planctomycetota bacterium]
MASPVGPTFINPLAVDNTQTASSRNGVSREQFLKILTAEMTHQNPLEPMENSEFMAQLAQLEQLSASSQVADGMKALLAATTIANAGSLIGKYIRGSDAEGMTVEGMVEKIQFIDGRGFAVLDNGSMLAFEGVQEIISADAVSGATGEEI